MKNINIVKLDSKGRLLLPSHIRKFLKLGRDEEILIVPQEKDGVLKIIPIYKDSTAEFQIRIKDIPGSLAHIAKKIAGYQFDIIMSESRTLERGKTAEWSLLVDIGDNSGKVDQLVEDLRQAVDVIDVQVIKK